MANEKLLIDSNEILEKGVSIPGCVSKMVSTWDIVHAPTVDAVEVVHGRWVIEKRHTISRNPYMDDNYHAHATCSECGFCIHSENASFGYPEMNTTNYCPNCGAKMDGDGNG